MSSELLPSGCGVCGQQENLLQCTGCQVLLYCGRDHEIADRLSHKSICRSMLRSRVTMEKEEQILRSPPEKFMMFGDAFIHHVGNFWGLTETRKYMRARLALVDGMAKVNTSSNSVLGASEPRRVRQPLHHGWRGWYSPNYDSKVKETDRYPVSGRTRGK
ncbi:hypothetical protein LT330_004226 [Penicillium expansum]|nr:hypothetical protein LT330_004226 [Penicillium expansum]